MTVIERETAPVEVLSDEETRARTLEAAALEIELRGWAQGAYITDRGRVCAVGAIMAAHGATDRHLSTGIDDPVDYDDLIAHTLGNPWPTDPCPLGDSASSLLIDYNDSWAERAEDVTFVLRWRAAEIRDGR